MFKVMSLLLIPFTLQAAVPIKKTVEVKEVFVPPGQTDDEKAVLFIRGELPNDCHEEPLYSISYDNNKSISVDIKSWFYEENNPFCPPQVKTFNKVIKIGKLKAGEYDILINEGSSYFEYETVYIEKMEE